MNKTAPILECVPNFSEGNRPEVIQAIAESINRVPGQALLHIDSSPSANRTVMTFAGAPEAVTKAAYNAIVTAAALIDMRQQAGAHPRIGATDVCPLIPLANMDMQEAVQWSIQLARRVGAASIPVYLYEHSSQTAYRKALPDIRKGQYEHLADKMRQPGWEPDYGFDENKPMEDYKPMGATVIGARDILVAFNISLTTKNENIARHIARRLRTADGGLPAVRAIGWYMEQYKCAQVSMNLLDYRVTSPWKAWEACKRIAASFDVTLIGCEVIGLIPEACLIEAGQLPGAAHEASVRAGIQQLGLENIRPFDPEEKVLEYVLEKKGLLG